MRWITRERAMVDRIACPWLINRFINPSSEFFFVPAQDVNRRAEEMSAIPFDVKGVELSHYWEQGSEHVSFEAIIKKYGLTDPGLIKLAGIVRGADANVDSPPPESAGLKALAAGFREISKDDHENMKLQFPAYDALYAYCKARSE